MDVTHGDHGGDGHAALSGAAVAGRDGGICGHADIRVRQHHHVVLGPAQGLDALAVARACFVDVARWAWSRRTRWRRRPDARAGRSTADPVSVDDAEDAVGQASLLQQLGHGVGRRGVLLGGLQDERVAARDGVAEHPHRHHGREVERRDASDHTKWLADLVHIHTAGDLLAEAALQEVRDAGRELEVLQSRAISPAASLRGPCRALRSAARQARRDAPGPGCGCGRGSPCASTATSRARPGTPPWHVATTRSTSSGLATSTARVWLPVAGLIDGAAATGRAGHDPPIDPVADPPKRLWRRRRLGSSSCVMAATSCRCRAVNDSRRCPAGGPAEGRVRVDATQRRYRAARRPRRAYRRAPGPRRRMLEGSLFGVVRLDLEEPSTPIRPSRVGTPTYRPSTPYWPSR